MRFVAERLQLAAHRGDDLFRAARTLGDLRLRLEAAEQRAAAFDADARERQRDLVRGDELLRRELRVRRMRAGEQFLAHELRGEARPDALQGDLSRKYERRVTERAERRMHPARRSEERRVGKE